MKDLRLLDKNKITIRELEKHYKIEEYKELHKLVVKLIDMQIIKPIKSSKLNGKVPSLYNKYTIIKDKKTKDYTDEILYKLNPKLNTSKYLKNPKLYEKDRDNILMLSKFLDYNIENLNTKISLNERSFQIWNREKFLQKEGGRTLIKNLGLSEDFFNFYNTTEPLAYYSNSKNIPQNILIIENKDTFYSMRNFVINNKKIFNKDISTIIYGGGKSIYKSFNDMKFCLEPYLTNKENKLLYLGDLDYEGILIYEKLSDIFRQNYEIRPFIQGYKAMIDKYKRLSINLQNTSENQNRNIESKFIDYFDDEIKNEILNILHGGKYIPQEILNIKDF